MLLKQSQSESFCLWTIMAGEREGWREGRKQGRGEVDLERD